ncbi:structural maintenance of chromosomes protein 6 isoform X1 [Labrus mixtus]|uniref:structural maintenance of chromosomes protein 6 isoform X1 n=1 Tax=Labrus mixtus TaxID=508554 RepID=UPI0029C0CA51|nr:structural maintenance of chromosomes protein 6 isoform X1 [Labrus mixtus]
MKNFMCHRVFGPFQFGLNVNFIVGNNGSGKSAILNALTVGLGGKATVTNRGVSLKDFVKTGEDAADITINLRNRGPDAYKSDVYGDCISVEHHIPCNGTRTCKLKSKSGKLISHKKEELTAILDHFNIQVDNPVSILNQEMSKQFLHTKSESDKYKFFMKATQLEQMKRDYTQIKQTTTVTRQQVERQEECLKDLKQEFLKKKERYETVSSFSEIKEVLENLKKKMAWCLVREKEVLVQQLKEDIEREGNNGKHQKNLQLYQATVIQLEGRLQCVKSCIDNLREQQDSLSDDCHKLKIQVRIINKSHKEKELVYFRVLNKLKHSEKEQNLLQEKINNAKTSRSPNKDGETEYAEQKKKISSLKKELAELESECSQLNQEINSKHQALFKRREEQDKLRLEERNIQQSYESKLMRKTRFLASQSNNLKRFGDNVPDLLNSISEAHAKGRFLKRPVGPLGACFSLNDPTLAVAVECCLRTLMRTFCCDNYKDEAVLQELMSTYYPTGTRPQIIVCPFSDKLYNIQGRKAYHPECHTLIDVITAPSPVIINCLIDMRAIESVLIIKEKDIARRIMQQGESPLNCREAFTAEGDQVYHNRYYTSDYSRAKYLGMNLQTEISVLESELENQQAQLSRFQLQVTFLSNDISYMENKLNTAITILKKTLASVNQIKATITELQTAGEEHASDISSLEEVANENRQKIKTEKQAVDEAKLELDKCRKKAEDMESEYSSVRKQFDQLLEEREPLKHEQEKLEAECTKCKHNFKIIENQLKAHEDNIQAMKSDLAQREEELQEYVAKASEISPERQQVTGSIMSVDREITQLKEKIKVLESSHGDREKVVREYAEALALYRKKTNQVTDLRGFIDRLDNIMSDRGNRYKVMRRSLSVRCKLYFNNFLIKMNCCGAMVFDHINETLYISVGPTEREDEAVRDTRSLSGGERSFSTVCFMLSLWEITESPFRCLDEFDVYMDMQNRRISLDLLLDLSQRQLLRQFIFITPLTTRNLPKSSLIKVHQLQGPHNQRETEDEDV